MIECHMCYCLIFCPSSRDIDHHHKVLSDTAKWPFLEAFPVFILTLRCSLNSCSTRSEPDPYSHRTGELIFRQKHCKTSNIESLRRWVWSARWASVSWLANIIAIIGSDITVAHSTKSSISITGSRTVSNTLIVVAGDYEIHIKRIVKARSCSVRTRLYSRAVIGGINGRCKSWRDCCRRSVH